MAKSFIRGLLDDPEDPQLPQYDPYAGMMTAKQAALLAAGLAPGAGVADAAGYMPRAEGGFNPSFRENVGQGNYLDATMQALGAGGDAAYALGPIGGLLGTGAKGLAGLYALRKAASLAPEIRAALDPSVTSSNFAKPANGLMRGDAVTGLTGAFAPSKAPVRGQTMQEIARMQKSMPSESGNIIADLRAKDPTFDQTAKFLLPNELEIIARNPDMIEPMKRLLDVIPSASQFASLSKAGAPKLGWYRGSTQALIDVFGQQDAPRFAALLAATSPQTSVESNLTNALNIWREWNAAGRPQDPAQIKAVMGRSVQGNKGEDSVLGAWLNNSVRALSSNDPLKTVLSGPKVDSFFRNLADDVYKVTNDAWMANVSGVDQGLFRKSPTAKQLSEGDAGFSPGYFAMNARQREAGQKINLLPNEVQETGWSVAMPLMELQKETGIPARELLQQGKLTPQMIAGTPDFETLFTQPQYADILTRAGYGSQLANLRPSVGLLGSSNALAMTAADQRNLMQSAKTLEDLGSIRGRESVAKRFYPGADFKSIMGYQPVEAIGGNGVGDFQGLLSSTPGSRDSFSNAALATFKDAQGHDIINRRLGLDTIATQPGQGAFQPKPGPDGAIKPLETNATGVTGFELPINKRGVVPEETQKLLDYSAARRGAFLGQYGVPNIAEVPKEAGPNIAVKRGNKLDAPTISGLLNEYPATAAVDTGRGAYVLNFADDPLTDTDAKKIAGLLSNDKNNFQRTASGMTNGRGYVDFERKAADAPRPDLPMFAAENAGKGLVTRELLNRYDALPARAQKAADTDPQVLQQAQDLLSFRQGKMASGGVAREDINNLIDILSRPGGHEMLRKAMESGSVSLPALAALGFLANPSAGLAAENGDGWR